MSISTADLVEKLGRKEQADLDATLTPDERVVVAIEGISHQALVCTNQRVIIIKHGSLAGTMFGGRMTSFDLLNISAVEIQRHPLTGYVEISTGGVSSKELHYWATDVGSVHRAPNAVPFNRQKAAKFEEAVRLIRQLVQDARIVQPQVAAPVPPSSQSIPEQIQQLATLQESGALTEDEFAAKKAELLARM